MTRRIILYDMVDLKRVQPDIVSEYSGYHIYRVV
jgi:hypothetical protein